MNDSKLRAWWWQRQGLDGSQANASPADVLSRAGWARSVGGVGPYLTLFARAGISREKADDAVAKVAIHELPAARGCTYVLPAADYAVGLTAAQQFGDADLKLVAKLGVQQKEIDALCEGVAAAVGDTPMDPEAIREKVGKLVRNLGDEGKKKGMITTLPVALGILQTRGLIRRIPNGGRLDQQRFKYVRWSPSPLGKSRLTPEEARTEVARRFFSWVGPATMKEFAWFAGLGVKAAKDIAESLGLVPAEPGSERLFLPADLAAFEKFKPSTEPDYRLFSSPGRSSWRGCSTRWSGPFTCWRFSGRSAFGGSERQASCRGDLGRGAHQRSDRKSSVERLQGHECRRGGAGGGTARERRVYCCAGTAAREFRRRTCRSCSGSSIRQVDNQKQASAKRTDSDWRLPRRSRKLIRGRSG